MNSSSQNCRIHLFTIVLFLLGQTQVREGLAQSRPPSPLVEVKTDWQGSWIWRLGDNVGNFWVAFRKTVDLDSAPTSAIASIAVDSKYWMWINGEPVIREGGLKRGPTPTDTYYDEVDLAPHLRAGENTIAIIVWYWGRSGFSHLSSGKGGLLFDANVDGRRIVSDPTWKVLRFLAYRESGAPGPNFRLSERNIRLQSDLYPDDWFEPEFDASSWPQAVVIGQPSGPPWNRLYKRPVPQWRWSELRPYPNQPTLPMTATGDTLVLDLPGHMHVTPYIKVRAVAGDTIEMRTDRYQIPSVDRVRLINTIRSEYITKDGEQEFETPAWMNGEAVRYYVPEGVEILDLRYRESGYDTDFVGSFDSSDPFLNRLWLKARATIYGTMRDYFMETAGRERKQATSDGSRAILSALYSMDDRTRGLMRKFWSEFSDWRSPTGIIRSGIPGNWLTEQPQINLIAYGEYGLWRYYLITGDLELLETVYPHVKQYLLLWNLDPSGLVIHRAGDWDWFDWEDNIDEPLMENASYQIALQAAIKMARETGNQADIPEWERRMELIHGAFNERFWQGSHYESPEHDGPPDDRGNALAYLAGLAEDRYTANLNAVLRSEAHASPYMDHFVLKALLEMGDSEGAIRRIRERYTPLVNHPSETLHEWWDTSIGSKEHPFTTGTLRLMTNHLAGIQPVEPGYTRASIEPNPGPLLRVEAEVPTDLGMLTMDLQRVTEIPQNEPAQVMRVTIPSGMTARVGIPKPPGALARIEVGDAIVWVDSSPVDQVDGIRPIIETDSFVRFEVAPGAWEFEVFMKPVPAQFVEVEADAEEGAAVFTWRTEEERDSTIYLIEERIDEEWMQVGSSIVEGDKGSEYQMRIDDPGPGWHTYRVAAIGSEGGISTSSEFGLEIPTGREITVSSPYPNPADRIATVELSVSEAQDIRADIFDSLGRRVGIAFRRYLEPGKRYRIDIPVSNLPAGTYGLRLAGDSVSFVRLVVAR